MVSSSCPACVIERCIDQDIPPDLSTIEDMMRKLKIMRLEADRMHAEINEEQRELISWAMEEPDGMENDELNQGIRAHQTFLMELQQLIMRIRRNLDLLCQGGILLERSTQSSSGTYQQDLRLMHQDQAEVLRIQEQLSQVHRLMIDRDLRTFQGVTEAAQRGRQMCTIL